MKWKLKLAFDCTTQLDCEAKRSLIEAVYRDYSVASVRFKHNYTATILSSPIPTRYKLKLLHSDCSPDTYERTVKN
jgi:hypothetical protein